MAMLPCSALRDVRAISCCLPWNDEVTRGIKTLGEIAHEL
jgi:hypothetical protein